MKKIITSFLFLFILCAAQAQEEDLLVHEPFDYATLNPLNWAESNEEGWVGEWTRAIGDDIIIQANNLDYNGWSTTPGNHLAANVNLVGTRYNRSIENIPDTGQVIWSSVLIDFQEGTNPNSVGNITLTKNGNQVFSFGKKFGNEKIGVAWPNAGGYNTDIDASGLKWLVVKIQFSGNNTPEQAWLWVDPATDQEPISSAADLIIPQAGLPNLNINFGIDGVQVKAEGDAPIFMAIDEFRMGKTWISVNPFFKTSLNTISIADNFTIFPNPTSSQLFISFDNQNRQELAVQLVSIDGKVIYKQDKKMIQPGHHQIEIPLNNLPLSQGLYFIQLIGDQGIQTEKFFYT